MITVTAPKKGLGQTVTAINIAAKVGSLLNSKVLLVDINQYGCGIPDYLSNAPCTRGLDEFKNNIEVGVRKDPQLLEDCSKVVAPNLNIMASNQYFNLQEGDIEVLQQHAEKVHLLTIVDSIAGKNDLTQIFIKKSKVVLVILNQDRGLVRIIKENALYTSCKDKVIFILNRSLESHQSLKMKYGGKQMTEELIELGFSRSQIYSLPFDVDLLNECNDDTLLNFSLAPVDKITEYHKKLDVVVRGILAHYGGLNILEEYSAERKNIRLFNFFNL